ncbi:MAG: HlyC/CorC family transporter [Verrucomicrobiales bacterium]|nr:HlyC/CorC family transporter [Verrucomicrobiales bacterium]
MSVTLLLQQPFFASLLMADNGLGRGLDGGEIGLQVFYLFLLILLNGFFVATEFAFVKIRDSQLDPSIEKGSGGAKLARHILGKMDSYLSACQLGITISSIVLGTVSVPFLYGVVEHYLSPFELDPRAITALSWILAVSIVTVLHVVIGEQMPKVLAIRKALRASVVCSRPLHWFYLFLRWPVWILNWCASFLLRVIFKIDPADTGEGSDFSADELRVLFEETGKTDEVTEREQEILINALELNALTVRDIITPRQEVVCLDINKSFEENMEVALESKHTRFPLVDGHLDRTVGLIHIKDLIGQMQNGTPDLKELSREMLIVPELVPLDKMLTRFQKDSAHMALVVDEYGGSLGLVMLDDVLDQIVGDIQDEFDEEVESLFKRISPDEFVVKGTFPLHELDDEVEELILESPDVSTVGGYITEKIGHMPEIGETVEIEGYQVKVTEADGKSVREAKFLKMPDTGRGEEAAESDDENGAESEPEVEASNPRDDQ